MHYINTPKQLILDFYDCKNDNFHLKIVIVLLLLLFCFFGSKINYGYTHNLFLSKKSVKECIPLSEPKSFFIKVWYIRWSKLYERVLMIKRFKKILPSNFIKEMYSLLSILLHLNIHKCDFDVYDVIPLQPRFGFIHTSIAFLYIGSFT